MRRGNPVRVSLLHQGFRKEERVWIWYIRCMCAFESDLASPPPLTLILHVENSLNLLPRYKGSYKKLLRSTHHVVLCMNISFKSKEMVIPEF